MVTRGSLCLLLLSIAPLSAEEVPSLLLRLKAVGKEGSGNAEARKAWKELAGKGPEVLPQVLAGLGDADPTAANWIRSAVESIADKAARQGKPLKAASFETFVKDRSQSGAARRLAYEYLVKLDKTAPTRLLPTMLDDPGQELRRDAVEVILKDAANAKDAKAAYLKALEHARDKDQVTQVADSLKKLGVDVNLTEQFGFVTRWAVTGPFNNVKGVGFKTPYPPEAGVDLAAKYVGKDGVTCIWEETAPTDKLGLVDFNKVVDQLKGAVYYAYSVIESPKDQPVEIRAGSNNAVRIWLNGKEIYFREEYHHGMRMDQHTGKGVLKEGRNEILIKVLQNEQTDSWAQQWSFQLRICDHLGGRVPFANITPKLSERKKGS